ncbi:hypothetical protein VTN96DRAFT_7189 [Rasamsonia emersonii]
MSCVPETRGSNGDDSSDQRPEARREPTRAFLIQARLQARLPRPPEQASLRQVRGASTASIYCGHASCLRVVARYGHAQQALGLSRSPLWGQLDQLDRLVGQASWRGNGSTLWALWRGGAREGRTSESQRSAQRRDRPESAVNDLQLGEIAPMLSAEYDSRQHLEAWPRSLW